MTIQPKRIIPIALICFAVLVTASSAMAAGDLVWVKGKDGFVPPGAVVAGKGMGGKLYICRTDMDGHLIPGTIDDGFCKVVVKGRVKANYAYEVLVQKIKSAVGGPTASKAVSSSISVYNKSGRTAAFQVTDTAGNEVTVDVAGDGTLRTNAECPCEIVEMDTARTLSPYRHARGSLVLDWNGESFRPR